MVHSWEHRPPPLTDARIVVAMRDETTDTYLRLHAVTSCVFIHRCDEITAKYNIFLTRDGRISMAGINKDNIDYVAGAIHAVTDGKKLGN